VTIGKEARDKLAELRNLLSHQIPDGDLAAVIERALDLLLAETKKTKAALVGKPRTKREKGALLETRGVKREEDALMREAGGKRHEREAGAEHDGKSGRTRGIPAQVRRAVFARDDGRCAFVDDEGRRCGSGWQVEFHHCVPYARGGLHGAENVELRCRAHNQYEAELEYGELFMSSVAKTRTPGG